MCRILGKALFEYGIEQHTAIEICSMYDQKNAAFNNPYFPAEYFSGFGKYKLGFTTAMVNKGRLFDVIILSHINLLLIGWLIKKISPHTKIILLAHGIEVWSPLSNKKKNMLTCCSQIWAVSRFTRDKIISVHGYPSDKCKVLNNCLDPFLPLPSVRDKSPALLDKYNFGENEIILMTLTRLSSKEQYKGYDKIIEAMAGLKDTMGNLKYLLAGSYDEPEKKRLEELISRAGLQHCIHLTGFISDEVLEDYFALSDIYIMPSRKEGFGIVFIEAMYYGLPVIAGNIDGSSDALLNGKLGLLVNPDDVESIQQAITTIGKNKTAFIPNRELMLSYFSYTAYKQNLHTLLSILN